MKNNLLDDAVDGLRGRLLGSLYFYFLYMYTAINGKAPEIPEPVGRHNHIKVICDALQAAIECRFDIYEILVLLITVPPRYGKTTIIIYAITWCYAHNAAANNIYGSFKKTLSTEKTEEMRKILQSKTFQELFDTRISKSSSAKDNFLTTAGGRTIAVGADGSGLGSGAGTSDKDPYGGLIALDDMVKATDAHSLAMQTNFARLFSGTLINRRNDAQTTPIVYIGQRIGENDPPGMLLNGFDDHPLDNYQSAWKKNAIVLPALDVHNHALWPEKHSTEYLLDLKQNDPWTFSSIFQQDPQPDSTRIFMTNRIKLFNKDPDIKATFIVIDTAETADEVNDATVFHLFGVYECEYNGQKTGVLGLHSLACYEVRVEPHELVSEFETFYAAAMRFPVRPDRVYCEKKSTGAMLLSFLGDRQGIIVIDIGRNNVHKRKDHLSVVTVNSKLERFKFTAPFVAKGQFSMTKGAEHEKLVIDHLSKITIGMSQRHDDIADTISDGITIALIDRLVYNNNTVQQSSKVVSRIVAANRYRRS